MTDCAFNVDVLCVGCTAYDFVLSVAHHPAENEKCTACSMLGCGGGVAANGAVVISRLGYKAAFCGYLGLDAYGEESLEDLINEGIDTSLVVRGDEPTSLSFILVKPSGKRTIVHYRADTPRLEVESLDLLALKPKAILLDRHEPRIAEHLVKWARECNVPTILDTGAEFVGTETIWKEVDYLVASESWLKVMSAQESVEQGILEIATNEQRVVVTQGERGLLYWDGEEVKRVPAFEVRAVDSTGAGDAFHGAFSVGVACGWGFEEILRYASAVGALSACKMGARPSFPRAGEVERFLEEGKG